MKRLVLILGTLVLLLSTAQAGDFLDSLRQYHVQILRHLNTDTTNTAFISAERAYAFVREGVVAVVPPIRSNKAIRTYTMTYLNNQITLDSDVVGVIAVLWKKNDSIKSLLPIPKEKWFQMEHKQTSGQKGYLAKPSYYAYIDGFLSVYPVPTNQGHDTLKVTVWVKAPNIATATAFTSIPTQYRTVILDYAIWKCAESKGSPLWKDFRDNFYLSKKELNASLGDPQITGLGVGGITGGGATSEGALPSSPAN